MTPNKDQSYEERIAQLERTIADLEYTVSRLQERLQAVGAEPLDKQALTPPERGGARANGNELRKTEAQASPPEGVPAPNGVRRSRPMYALNVQAWLQRIGLFFVLFGVSYGLKYFLLDQTWISPFYRVVICVTLGTLLTLAGFRLHRKRTRLAQVLLCGGVGLLFLTAFAAFKMYNLVPYLTAYLGMFAISVAAFLVSVKRDDAVVAIIGVFGGLATPFIVHSQGDNPLGIISYTTLILMGAGAIYWFKGWRSLLFLSSIGGWMVILLCYLNVGLYYESVSADRWTLLFGVFACWVLFWAVPVIRGILRAENPERYAAPPPVRAVGYFFNHPALPLSVATPLLAMIFSMLIWNLSDRFWGWVALETAAIYGFLYLYIRGRHLNHLAQIQGFTASLLLVGGLFLLFQEYAVLVALASAGAVMRHVARLLKDRVMSFNSHLLFLIVDIWLAMRLIETPASGTPVFNMPGMSELAVIVLGASMMPVLWESWMYKLYLFSAHFLFLGWLYREVGAFPDGAVLVTTCWGLYAIGLLFVARKKHFALLRRLSLGTIALAIGKLFLFDLDAIDPLIRVILFLVFGLAFLTLSFLLPRLIARNALVEESEPPSPLEHEEEPIM